MKEFNLNQQDLNDVQDEVAAEIQIMSKYGITAEELDDVTRVLELYEEGTDINEILNILKGMNKGQQDCFRDYAKDINNDFDEDEDALAEMKKYGVTPEEYDDVSRLLELWEEGTDINDLLDTLKEMSKGQQRLFWDYSAWEEAEQNKERVH